MADQRQVRARIEDLRPRARRTADPHQLDLFPEPDARHTHEGAKPAAKGRLIALDDSRRPRNRKI